MARIGYRKVQNPDGWDWNLKSLGLAFVLSSLALWAVYSYSTKGFHIAGVEAGPPAEKTEKSEFSLGGIRFGMTPETVRRLNPSLSLDEGDAGNLTGTFVSSNGGAYTVYFLNANGAQKSFGLRFVRSYDGFDENDLISKISAKFGRPATSNCYKSSFMGSKECQFSWLAGGISLKAVISRFVSGGKKGRATLMLIAVDTLIEGRRLRSLREPVKSDPAYPLKGENPFPF